MSATMIPGLKSGHQLITPLCRANRGRMPAFDEAVARIRSQYETYSQAPANSDVTWHLVLVREDDE